jgi:transposase
MAATKECPSCGAEIPAVSFKCEFCGFEIKTDQSESINIIQELQNKLIEADNSVTAKQKALYGEAQVWNKKASIINAFTLPTTKKDLVDLLLFAYSNYEGSKGTVKIYGDPVKNAWLGKAKQAYTMLKTYGKDDEHVASILDEYSFLATKSKKSKKGCLPVMLIGILPLIILLLLIFK